MARGDIQRLQAVANVLRPDFRNLVLPP